VFDGWAVRIYYNPLVIWIWIGAIVTFFGGILAILKNFIFLRRINL
jgi:cytochrome c biogenesis factor